MTGARANVLLPRSQFVGLPAISSQNGCFSVDGCETRAVALVLARRGKSETLAVRVSEEFGLELPRGPYRAASRHITLAGLGPNSWLATHEGRDNDLVGLLTRGFGDLASVSDQTDSYAVMRLSGTQVRPILSALVPIDVHSRSFKVGDVATTIAGDIPSMVWRLEDGDGQVSVFEIAVSRSLTGSMWHMLSELALVYDCQSYALDMREGK